MLWKACIHHAMGLPGGSDGKESAFPGLGRSSGGGHGHPLQYSCLEDPRGQRSLVGCCPRGHKESDTTEWLGTAHAMLCFCFDCVTDIHQVKRWWSLGIDLTVGAEPKAGPEMTISHTWWMFASDSSCLSFDLCRSERSSGLFHSQHCSYTSRCKSVAQ